MQDHDTNIDTTPIIARTAMLAALNISQWSARKFDKELTTELNVSKGARDDAARVNKLLVDSEVIKPVQKLANEVRGEFYHRTLPWGADGERIMPANIYTDWMQYFSAKQSEFNAAADHLAHTEYPAALERAKDRLGTMFNIDDYPDPADIRDKFDMGFGVRPVPTANDFRVNLSGEVGAAIRQQVRDDIERLTGQTVQHLWSQVGTMLTSIRDRLADPDARFKAALVENFTELVHDLDKLNVANDPDLDKLRNSAEKQLLALRDPEALRKDKATRQAAVAECDDLIDQFSGMWG